LNLRDEVNYITSTAKNEKGTQVTYASGNTLRDNIILQAAALEYLQQLMKKRGYPANQLDIYTNAAYNLGPYHKDLKNPRYIQKNYSIPHYAITIRRLGGTINNKVQLVPKKFTKGGPVKSSETPVFISRADFLKTNVDQYYPEDATLIDDGYQLRIPYPRIIIKKRGGKLIPRKR
jgi:hypothetical protein